MKTPTDVRDIWMGYLEYMRRRYDAPEISKEEEVKRLEELDASFEKAIQHILACKLRTLLRFFSTLYGHCSFKLRDFG